MALVAVTSAQLGGLGKGKGKSGKGGKGGLLGGGKSGGGMAGLAKEHGDRPRTRNITSMVCQTFDGKTTSMGKMIGNMFGSPNGKGPDEKCMVDKSGGSGPYKAHYIDAPGLASHTIYAPINPPSTPLPVIIWGNGFCMSAGKQIFRSTGVPLTQSGTMFANFLNEIASHGFFIVANGPATGSQLGGQTTYRELIKSMDWLKTPQAKKWNLDTSKLAVSGQSCGGLEAVCALKEATGLD